MRELRRPTVMEKLTEEIESLGNDGMRLAFSFPETMEAQQRAWPEDAPLSEAELRSELQAIVDAFNALHARAGKLCEKLPPLPEAELDDEVPRGLYFALADALDCAQSGGDLLEYLESALEATPESLRAEWLQRRLRDPLMDLMAEEGSGIEPLDVLTRLIRTLSREVGMEGGAE